MFSIAFSGSSHNGLHATIPALFMRISTLPISSFTRRAVSLTWSLFEMSTTYDLHSRLCRASKSTVVFMAVKEMENYIWFYIINWLCLTCSNRQIQSTTIVSTIIIFKTFFFFQRKRRWLVDFYLKEKFKVWDVSNRVNNSTMCLAMIPNFLINKKKWNIVSVRFAYIWIIFEN